MDQRIVEFIAGLRAAGVRVSIAESQDAFHAASFMGVQNRNDFRHSLRTTLVKEAHDQPIFDNMFPLYFGTDSPPMLNLSDDLSPEEQQMLQQALRDLLQQMGLQGDQQQGQQTQEGQRGHRRQRQDQQLSSQQLKNLMELLQSLLQGQNLDQETLDRLGQQAGLDQARNNYEQRWVQSKMMRELGMQILEQLMQQLPGQLQQQGMSQDRIDQLMEDMEANKEALAEQIARFVGRSIAEQRAEEDQRNRQTQQPDDLMHRPFDRLSEEDANRLKQEVRRLVAQLRSRAALRRKRAKSGTLDAKRTIRTNLRYGGVPLELKFKYRHLKPKLVLVCDLSTSMRNTVSFLLRMIYELQDQVSSAHSFGFVSDLGNITEDFAQHPPDQAVEIVLARPDLQPGYYSTDLGNSLNTLMRDFAGSIDNRTTVVFVGDGRNNYRDPRLDLMDQIKRRGKRIIWLNPEHPQQWASGDSDMLDYFPFAAAVHRVSNMAELAQAVDKLLTAH
ncbi:MAG TPA: VWA domain-containing protein [Anaerolineae bacterium]|nr:VWA domain-containing protein [Anaerolineae bacterium]HMR63242.1 VWA domain-containing protein [Anaerolineae bacterium]